MVDKRETKRERREDAKRRRLEELKRRQRQARNRKIMMWGAVGLAVAGIIAAVVLLGGGGGKSKEELERIATAAGCATIKSFPNEGSEHKPPFEYKTNPPTSGNHNSQWADTGIHTSPVAPEQSVHNLEHGAIVIHYKTELDGQILNALEEVVRGDSRWILLTPSPSIPAPLTFSSWQHHQLCSSPTTPAAVKAAAQAFVAERKDKAPESIPGAPTGV